MRSLRALRISRRARSAILPPWIGTGAVSIVSVERRGARQSSCGRLAKAANCWLTVATPLASLKQSVKRATRSGDIDRLYRKPNQPANPSRRQPRVSGSKQSAVLLARLVPIRLVPIRLVPIRRGLISLRRERPPDRDPRARNGGARYLVRYFPSAWAMACSASGAITA
jgi:hypothetical protein